MEREVEVQTGASKGGRDEKRGKVNQNYYLILNAAGGLIEGFG